MQDNLLLPLSGFVLLVKTWLMLPGPPLFVEESMKGSKAVPLNRAAETLPYFGRLIMPVRRRL